MSSVYDNKIYFGKFSDVGRLKVDLQDKNVLYIDTREEIREDRKLDVTNLMLYPLNDKVEHENRDTFMMFINDLIAKVKDNMTLFIVDYSGAGQSAMIAWVVYCMTINGSYRDTKTEVNEAYLKQDVEEKWKVLGAPRYGRLRSFGMSLVKDLTWNSYRTNIQFCSVRMSTNQNKIYKRRGQIRTGRMVKSKQIYPRTNTLLPEFKSICIENRNDIPFRDLCPSRIRIDSIPMYDKHGRMHTIKVRNIYELILVCSVYDEQLENGYVNEEFFSAVQYIVNTRKCITSHPLQKYKNGKITQPKCYFWKGRLLSKVEFRIIVLSPIYAEEVQKTKKYLELQKLVEHGNNIHLLSYDADDYVENGMNLCDVLFSEDQEWTHVHILNGLLTNQHVWVIA